MKSLTCFSSRSRGTCCAVILERLAENCRGRTTAIICTRTNAPKYILESHRLHFGSICDQNGRNFEPWCNGTRIPRNCQQVSGPSTVYHLVFTPILPFPYFNLTEECFSTWRWKVHNSPLTNKSFFSRPYDACNDITRDQCQAWICHARRFFSKMFN